LKFEQSVDAKNEKFTRLPLYEVWQKFGSYLAFLIRFTMLILKDW